MFTYPVDEQIQLKLITVNDAEEIFTLVDKNRENFREWLGWLNGTTKPGDTAEFTKANLHRFAERQGVDTAIVYEGKIVGKVTLNAFSASTKIASIGYMLDKEYSGKGIMTRAVKAMIEIAFQEFGAQKVEIHAAVGNTKSRAIPERLGFVQEGIIRQSEWLYDHYVDHVAYGLLKSEWQA